VIERYDYKCNNYSCIFIVFYSFIESYLITIVIARFKYAYNIKAGIAFICLPTISMKNYYFSISPNASIIGYSNMPYLTCLDAARRIKIRQSNP